MDLLIAGAGHHGSGHGAQHKRESVFPSCWCFGESLFGDYLLRGGDIPKPSCDLNQDIDAALKAEVERQKSQLANDDWWWRIWQ